jgi:DNA-binding NtrC family response regulator
MAMRIVIAEDDRDFLAALTAALEARGHRVEGFAETGASLAALKPDVDLLLTDLRLADGNGLDLVRKARAAHPRLEILVMTAFGTIESAVEAMRLGARNFLTKPFAMETLLGHLSTAEEMVRLRRVPATLGRGELLGSSPAMGPVFEAVDFASSCEMSVLILGETGTGKGLVASTIHEASARRNGPFVAVNLGAIPAGLMESLLFGHVRGAFSGADRDQQGRFALAAGGTLLLDELDCLPLELQPKLLRALESREFWPIGAKRAIRADLRVIAASNAPAERLRNPSALRPDLYFRLNTIEIQMPPLRERIDDIPLLAHRLLDREIREAKRGEGPRGFSAEALAELIRRPWPGNVRELRSAIQYALARAVSAAPHAALIGVEHLPPVPGAVPSVPFKQALAQASEEWTVRTIRAALAASGGNVSGAARSLKMETSSLFRLLKRHGIKTGR